MAALLWFGQRFVRQGLAFFGHALSGGGLVVLYVAIYAALHVYGLIAPSLAFAAMLAVTALGIWLADRHRVQVLGALALLGAFVTPVLVGGGEDRQLFLFVYNALLLAGRAGDGRAPRVGRRRRARVRTRGPDVGGVGGHLLPAGPGPADAPAPHDAPGDRGRDDRRAATAARAIAAGLAGVLAAGCRRRCCTTRRHCG